MSSCARSCSASSHFQKELLQRTHPLFCSEYADSTGIGVTHPSSLLFFLPIIHSHLTISRIEDIAKVKVSILGLGSRQPFCQLIVWLRVFPIVELLVCFHVAANAELGGFKRISMNFVNLEKKLHDWTVGRKQCVCLKSLIRSKLEEGREAGPHSGLFSTQVPNPGNT